MFNLHVGVLVIERPPFIGRGGGRGVTELGPFPWINPRRVGDRIVSDPVTITGYPVGGLILGFRYYLGELLIHETYEPTQIEAVPPGELTLTGLWYGGRARVPR